MMGKAHRTVGMATALALTAVNTPAGIAAALAGGALGGVLPDVDTLKNDYQSDALIAELLAAGVVAAVAVLDFFLKWGICADVMANRALAIVGGVAMLALWVYGFPREHRTATHSLLLMLLFSVAAAFVHVPFGAAVLVGYLSHLLLDLLNKRGIQLFFPFKARFCLHLCYAGKTANKVFTIIGAIATLALMIFRVVSVLIGM